MTARRTPLATAERDTYRVNRALRTARAAKRGPAPLAKRYVHRAVAKAVFRGLRSTFR